MKLLLIVVLAAFALFTVYKIFFSSAIDSLFNKVLGDTSASSIEEAERSLKKTVKGYERTLENKERHLKRERNKINNLK